MAAWNLLQGPFLADRAEAGYPAQTIDIVLCTHLHVDHVGWNTRLVEDKWVPMFPNARYLFGRREWEHWCSAAAKHNDGDVMGDSVRPIIDAGLAELVDMNHALTPEVRLGGRCGARLALRDRATAFALTRVILLKEARGSGVVKDKPRLGHFCRRRMQ